MKYFGISVFFLVFCVCLCLKAEEKKKVISLSPNITETIFHLGGGDTLVGRSSACDYPEEAKKLAVTGGFGAPSLEKIALMQPDIVITSTLKDMNMRKSIENLGIKFYLLPMESIDDYLKGVKELGLLLDCKGKADEEITRIEKGLESYRQKAEKTPFEKRPLVYLEIWDNPTMTVGKISFINDIITLAGGRNIAGEKDRSYFSCSREWVLLSRPDVIICPAMKDERVADIKKRPGWDEIPAIKNSRIYVNINQNLIYRLGPRILDGIGLLRKCFYPEEK